MPIRSRKTDPLDDTSKRFLQIGQNAPEIHAGQKIDDDKLKGGWERALFAEACDYGDDLVVYTTAHHKLSPEEIVWGFCLGLYCARGVYPNGAEEFDDLGDQAAKDLVLSATTIVTDEEEIARIQTALPEFPEERFREAAVFSENFQEFLKNKKIQTGISNRQGAYGLGRAFHNLRRTFPVDRGGSAAFDELARRAGVYFVKNKE
jgi:hypothetical protein